MENASKALLMAGGMLLAILVVSLLIIGWNMISKYQSSQDELVNIENTAKFNEQFANYNRKDINGYEVLSLVHKVIDYNERKTKDSTMNTDRYPAINLTINMLTTSGANDYVNALSYDGTVRLFKKPKYNTETELSAKNRNDSNSFERGIEYEISNAMTKLKLDSGNEDAANKIAKNIGSIFMTEAKIKERADRLYNKNTDIVYSEMANKYNECTGEKFTVQDAKDKLELKKDSDNNNKYFVYACELYEYMQFKRSVFECTTFDYDKSSGRVSTIVLNFVKVR